MRDIQMHVSRAAIVVALAYACPFTLSEVPVLTLYTQCIHLDHYLIHLCICHVSRTVWISRVV